MKLIASNEGGIVVLEPIGRLDKKALSSFQQRSAELLKSGERLIVIDLGKTDLIDGSGLRSLLALKKRLEANAGSLSLCNVQPEVGSVLRLAGFTRFFSISKTRAEALERFTTNVVLARLADLVAALLATAEKRELAARSAG